MSEDQTISSRGLKLYTYLLASFLLALPLILWPFLLIVPLEVPFAITIVENWAASAAVMLLTVTVIDSIFSCTKSLEQLITSIAWVVVTAVVLYKVLYASNSAYLLGLMFFVHSLRSSSLLWQGESYWWLWPAWLRDNSMALLLIFWTSLFLS